MARADTSCWYNVLGTVLPSTNKQSVQLHCVSRWNVFCTHYCDKQYNLQHPLSSAVISEATDNQLQEPAADEQ